MSRIMPKFMFLEALSYVTDNNSEKFAETLKEITERYSEADVAPLASSYLKLLKEGRTLNAGGSNVRGMVWSTRLTNDSTKVSLSDAPANFSFRADTAQVMMLIYPNATVDGKQLLFDVARHNFSTYSVRDFDLEPMSFGDIGLIVISGFRNRSEAEAYRSGLESSAVFRLPVSEVVPVIMSKGDYDLLLNEGRSLEEYFEAAGDDRLRKVHESVLPPDEFDEPVIPQEAPETNTEPEPEPESEVAPATEAEQTTEVAPAEPEKTAPQPTPTPKPKPTPTPKPTPAPKPQQPEIPVGSEGDDPLFD